MIAAPDDPGDRDAPPDDGAALHARGSFFGRRKGHKLRIHQADLIDNLLPHLALDIGTPAPDRSRRAVRRRHRRCQARNRIRRRRASDRGSAGVSRYRVHRLRALRQRHGEDPDADRGAEYRQYQALRRRRRGAAGLGAGAIAGADRPDPSRSLAEAPALEAALRAGRHGYGDGAHSQGWAASFVSSATSTITAPGRWRI